MVALIKARQTAAFIASEPSSQGLRGRDVQTFDSTTDWGGEVIPVGQVFAVVGGAAVAFDGDGVDGSEVAAGILYEAVPAGETVDRTVITRDTEVVLAELTFDGTDAEVSAALAANGIIVRT